MSAVLYTIFFINWKKKEKWLAEEENDLQSHDISGWVFIRPAAIYPQVKEFDTHTHTHVQTKEEGSRRICRWLDNILKGCHSISPSLADR